jgi:acetyl-CoA acetyltransferase
MAVFISGVGMTRFGKRNESLLDLMVAASDVAIEESGSKSVDAIFVGAMSPDEFTGDAHCATAFADSAGLTGLPAIRVETGMSTGASVFQSGFYALASGMYENVLLVGGEKMTHIPTSSATKILSKVISTDERRIGASMPSLAALVTRRYMYEFGLDRESLSLVPVKNHGNAIHNPYAQFQKSITTEDVMKSRIIADPLTIYDCAPISDGACAMVISRSKNEVECAGIGHATDTWSLQHRDSLTSFQATKHSAKKAYEIAKVQPRDVDVAELHDAFSTFEIIDSEDVGFFAPGTGWKAWPKSWKAKTMRKNF